MKFYKAKHAARLPVSAYLMYVIIATLLFTGVTFSGYVSMAGGSGSAKVAKFEIVESDEGGVLDYEETIVLEGVISPTSPMTKIIQVQNKSEVSVEYTMELLNVTGNIPLSIQAYEEQGSTWVKINDGNDTDLSVTAQLDYAGGETDTAKYRLEIGMATTDPAYMSMIDQIQVTLIAEQSD